jgi:DNA-directed RNA polymerase specialized sigma24 family protein
MPGIHPLADCIEDELSTQGCVEHIFEITWKDLAGGMPEKHKEVFQLRCMGYRFVEIAKALQIPSGTAKTRMLKAMEMARRQFESMVM